MFARLPGFDNDTNKPDPLPGYIARHVDHLFHQWTTNGTVSDAQLSVLDLIPDLTRLGCFQVPFSSPSGEPRHPQTASALRTMETDPTQETQKITEKECQGGHARIRSSKIERARRREGHSPQSTRTTCCVSAVRCQRRDSIIPSAFPQMKNSIVGRAGPCARIAELSSMDAMSPRC